MEVVNDNSCGWINNLDPRTDIKSLNSKIWVLPSSSNFLIPTSVITFRGSSFVNTATPE